MNINKLEIANARGKKAFMKDLKKIQKDLSSLLIELNPNDAKKQLKMIDDQLFNIINDPQNA